jgi:RNA polymerase sigma-70 factor, ECF subfamily
MTITAATTTAATEAATTSAPHESPDARGRPVAAAARTEELFAAHRRTVFGLCRALLRDPVEAEDALQQTFLSAHRALLNGTRPQAPAAWLATIARNECWSRISTRMREPLPTAAVEAEAPGADPLAEALRRADLAALWQAIEALPRAQRNALLLREFGGMSYEELAAALDVSGSAVESLLFRARTRLRGQLRTAYAALTGASWLEALARLVAGGGAPAAAKVAVLGVGAAAVGSGAVVVPRAFDNHHPSHAPVVVTRHQAARHAPKRRPVPVLAVSVVAPTVRVPPPLRITTEAEHTEQQRRARRSGETETEPVEQRSGGGGGGRDGGREQDRQARTQPAPAPAVTTVESGDDRSGPSSGGSDGRDGGHDGSGGGDDSHDGTSGPGGGGDDGGS